MKRILTITFTFIITFIINAQEINLGISGHIGMWKQYTSINSSITKNKWTIRPSIKYGNFGKND